MKIFKVHYAILMSIFLLIGISKQSFAEMAAYSFVYPVGNINELSYNITQKFNTSYSEGFNKDGIWYYGHTGIDLGCGESGGEVVATEAGIVIESGEYGGWGYMVKIKHKLPSGDVVYSQYGHMLENSLLVNKGDTVYRGQGIGEVGDTGFSTGPHLHFEIKKIETNGSGYSFGDPNIIANYYNPLGFIENHYYIPLSGDWNADGDDTIGHYRTATFSLDNDIDNNISGDLVFQFGLTKDTPITGDWDADGQDTIGVYRPTTSEFFLDYNNDGIANENIQFGESGDFPIIGDWDGDGYDTIGVYRPSTRQFFLDYNNDGIANVVVAFGNTGDIPIVGDWDGDDDDDIGIFRSQDPTVNTNTFYLDLNLTGGVAELGPYQFGDKNDLPVIGDWDGDGDDNIGIYRSSIREFFLEPNIPQSSLITNIDVALIIDSSGSMGWNDPQDLRKEAAKIFVDTAQNDDQIAVVDFDSWSYLRWSLQPLTENRDNIKSAVDLINSSGGTSLSAGLLEGYNQLDSSTQPYKKAAVFLTDGVGTYNNEAELYKNENNDNDCWPIYTIGLGYDTNPSLLQNIADTTGGKYFALTDPNQLQNVYFEIATQISGGNLLASESSVMSTGDTYIASVAVPAGQQSATFLTTWPGSDVNTTLTSPGGSEITPTTSDPNIYYAKGLTYELYRITNPEAGGWEISLYCADLAIGGETVNISVSSVGPPVPEDTTAPVITISNPIGGKTYFDQMPTTFSFTIEDPETAVTSQTALLNGSPINNNDNILLTQLGENVLTITATNEANLTSELSITFYVNHFSWLPPIKYEKGSSTQTITYIARANSTLPIKFAIFNADDSFIADNSVKVIVEGTTAQFLNGEGDTNIRINQEEGEDPLYIVNLHTNFNKCDYGLEAGNEYNLTVYFNDILAAKTKLKIE